MNQHVIVLFVVIGVSVVFFQIVDLKKAGASLFAYLAFAEFNLTCYLAFQLRAGILAVLMLILTGLTAAFVGQLDESPSAAKIIVASLLILAGVAASIGEFDPQRLPEVLLLRWFYDGISLSFFARTLVWWCYAGMAYGVGLFIRQQFRRLR